MIFTFDQGKILSPDETRIFADALKNKCLKFSTITPERVRVKIFNAEDEEEGPNEKVGKKN